MLGRRVHGGSKVAVLLQKEGVSPDTIQALLGSSSGGFQTSRSMLNFEDVCRRLDAEEVGDEDAEDYLHQPEKKRRLAVDQVKFLERFFELDNKLDPERKIQLAKELGLQPRQVAIWFQNRRARWKTKQLEKDYESLKANYNSLKADYENLLKEKEMLQSEATHLTDKLLLKENNKASLKLEESAPPSPKPESDSSSKAAIANAGVSSILQFKQEDLSSTNSVVIDSESPRCAEEVGRSQLFEPAVSSNVFDSDRSDVSHAGDGEVEHYNFLKSGDGSNDYGFPVDDHAFLFWPY